MKVVTFEDIQKLNIDPCTCYQWVEEMVEHKRDTILPPKVSLSSKVGMFMNTMPCILNQKWAGIKVVNRYPERVPALDSKLLLLNNETGDFLALMDANWITAMRTGAVAAHSIVNLAKNGFSVVGMMGLGNTCIATLLVLASVLKDKKMTIKILRYKNQAEEFITRFRNFDNLQFVIVDTCQEIVRGSEVVVSCITYAGEDLCPDECFDEGVLVVPVHTRGFSNCDLFFDKIYADDYGHVCHFKNFDKFKSFNEVCDVINGIVPGRESDKERILAYNIGVAIHDIHFAAHIYNLIQNEHNICNIDMCEPKEKIWL